MFRPFTRFRNSSILARFRASRPSTSIFTFVGLLTWLPVLSIVQSHFVSLKWVTGPSMYPLLNPDFYRNTRKDVVLVDMWNPSENVKRGMVVSFWSPNSPDTMVIKRVVALAGDTVKTKKPYPFPEEIVPIGHVWVEGEHPESDRWSRDSNYYGPISLNLLTGKVRRVVWPLNRAGRLLWQEYKGNPRVKEGTPAETIEGTPGEIIAG